MLSFISMEFKSWRSVFTDHPAMNTIRPAPARLVHPAAGERGAKPRRQEQGGTAPGSHTPLGPHADTASHWSLGAYQ